MLHEGVYDREAILQEILPKVISFGSNYTKDRVIEPHLVDKLFKKELIQQELICVNQCIYWGEDVLITFKCIIKTKSYGDIKFYSLPLPHSSGIYI